MFGEATVKIEYGLSEWLREESDDKQWFKEAPKFEDFETIEGIEDKNYKSKIVSNNFLFVLITYLHYLNRFHNSQRHSIVRKIDSLLVHHTCFGNGMICLHTR